jgi:uncharacterized membrane protein (UPF0182 family)
VAVREIKGAPSGRSGWINEHLIYTHGYGFVAALGNRVNDKGEPVFVAKDIPQSGQSSVSPGQPRIYFGQNSPSYSIVHTKQAEFDYPDSSSSAGQQNFTYSGSGGVPIGSFFRRLLYATKYKDTNLLLSGAVTHDSRILYDRDPRQRVQKVAPWLTLDGSPYPAVVNNHIVWIVDGYTTSDAYPYSERMSLGDATSDTITETRSTVAKQANDQINYMRNSVKATVDAYDGTVRLYQWDDSDPIVNTWKKAFPGTVLPRSAMPASLVAHLRYPSDLFKVQRRILARYHVQDAGAFYGGQDFWEVPQDPTAKGKTQPPYYVSLRMPDQAQPSFSLMTDFTPRGRPNLAAYLSADADASGSSYGTLRILQVRPANGQDLIPGPGQVQNKFESDAAVKDVLNKLRLGGTQTILGNMLTLPFAGGFLYVEPIYAQASAGAEQEPYPILQQVLVMYGSNIGYGTNLQDALSKIFTSAPSSSSSSSSAGGGVQQPPTTSGPVSEDVKKAIAAAQKAFTDGQAALKKGDWVAYGKAQQALQTALQQLATAEKASTPKPTTGPSVSPSPSASPSATP